MAYLSRVFGTEIEDELLPLPGHGEFRYRVGVQVGAAFLRAALGMCVCLTLGCQNYSDQLQRAQGYYERNQYEMALTVVRNLEADQDSLSQTEAVRYCYVRGMTDYRLGYESDARYWLGLAKASIKNTPGALQSDEVERVNETLDELNRPIFGLEQPSEQDAVSR